MIVKYLSLVDLMRLNYAELGLVGYLLANQRCPARVAATLPMRHLESLATFKNHRASRKDGADCAA